MRIPDLLTRRFFLVTIYICVAFWVAPAQAQSGVGPKASAVVTPIAKADGNSSISSVPANSNEIEEMKADLARQQREILDLQKTVDRQQKLIEQLLHFSATTKPVEESTAAIIQPAATTLQPTGTAAVGPLPAESSAVEPIRKVKTQSRTTVHH